MKDHFSILLLAAATLASCAPYPASEGVSRNEDARVPAPELKEFRKIPTGHPDPRGRSHMVVSPYRPYNIIDISGYQSGDVVGDPSTAIVNPATGKRDPSTAKYFRVP